MKILQDLSMIPEDLLIISQDLAMLQLDLIQLGILQELAFILLNLTNFQQALAMILQNLAKNLSENLAKIPKVLAIIAMNNVFLLIVAVSL